MPPPDLVGIGVNIAFDRNAASAVFTPPRSDGGFTAEFADYLRGLGSQRPSVILAFPPKAAGTFFRSAAIVAIDGQLVRTVHANGGRDGSFYLPIFILYYAGNMPDKTMVTHVHMQALPANRHFIDAFGLKPVIMIRSIPDMLASYGDMLEADAQTSDNWLNVRLPAHFMEMTQEARNDFLIDMFGPWYASYFATWLEYAQQAPARVCVLRFHDFTADPAAALQKALDHSGVARTGAECKLALANVWEERHRFRFNQGVEGRGRQRFTPEQIARLERMLDYYPGLADYRAELVPPAHAMAGVIARL
jgi:hypothetical protein